MALMKKALLQSPMAFAAVVMATLVVAAQGDSGPTTITELPGYGSLPVPAFSGYLDVNTTDIVTGAELQGSLFYFFQPAIPSAEHTDAFNMPLVLWLNGGPGCSSLFGAFLENGLILMRSTGDLQLNPKSFAFAANVLYIDAPFGAGFSYAANNSVVDSEETYSSLMVAALAMWRAIPNFHSYNEAPFFIWGESYAGHYIPAVASKLVIDNEDIAGIGIGNGWIDARVQYPGFLSYALNHTLLNHAQATRVNASVASCLALLGEPAFNVTKATNMCGMILDQIIEANPHKDPTKIDRSCSGMSCFVRPEWGKLVSYMQTPAVLDALGVRPQSPNFTLCADMGDAFAADYFVGLSPALELLLARNKTRVLLYNGDQDLVCPDVGDLAVASSLRWPGQRAFDNAPSLNWTSDNQHTHGGTVKCSGKLAFATVAGAGHQVPADQPKAALSLFSTALSTWFC
eukprot:m.321353 g.321353  ORF g.321353 m.321353 type:complete len:458 (-) comp19708_c19_seq3:23-1396(-)